MVAEFEERLNAEYDRKSWIWLKKETLGEEYY